MGSCASKKQTNEGESGIGGKPGRKGKTTKGEKPSIGGKPSKGGKTSSRGGGSSVLPGELLQVKAELFRIDYKGKLGNRTKRLRARAVDTGTLRVIKVSDAVFLHFGSFEVPLAQQLPIMQVDTFNFVVPGPDCEYGITVHDSSRNAEALAKLLEKHAALLQRETAISKFEEDDQREYYAEDLDASDGPIDIKQVIGSSALVITDGARRILKRFAKEITPDRMRKAEAASEKAVKVTNEKVDQVADLLTAILHSAYNRGVESRNGGGKKKGKKKGRKAMKKARKAATAGLKAYDAIHAGLEAAADAMVNAATDAVVTEKRFGKDGAKSAKHGIKAARNLSKLAPSKLLRRGGKKVGRNVVQDASSSDDESSSFSASESSSDASSASESESDSGDSGSSASSSY